MDDIEKQKLELLEADFLEALFNRWAAHASVEIIKSGSVSVPDLVRKCAMNPVFFDKMCEKIVGILKEDRLRENPKIMAACLLELYRAGFLDGNTCRPVTAKGSIN